MRNYLKFTKKDFNLLLTSVLITIFVFGGFYVEHAYSAENVTLQVTISSVLTFTSSTNNFPSLTPGTPVYATTTLSVATNDYDGYNITFAGDDQSDTDNVMDSDFSSGAKVIDDQIEWTPGGGTTPATTTAGTAVRISSMASSSQVLAFRVMTASGSLGFRAATWWGSADNWSDDANTLFAGIPSSTVQRQIGNCSASSTATALSTVSYYLDVPGTQETGVYSGGVTFTATAN